MAAFKKPIALPFVMALLKPVSAVANGRVALIPTAFVVEIKKPERSFGPSTNMNRNRVLGILWQAAYLLSNSLAVLAPGAELHHH